MNHFKQKNGELYCEDVSLMSLVQQYGTPLYVYSAATFRRHFQAFDSAFAALPHLCCFSVKANGNLSILKLLAQEGAGMDIVSGGELYRALAAGVPGDRIVYSGVGKTRAEISEALDADILMFNVESTQELDVINELAAAKGKVARISLRINPDVDPQTHPYISTGLMENKFGLDLDTALETYKTARSYENVDPIGIDCHIGSQLTKLSPFLEALERLMNFHKKLVDLGIAIKYLDLGGGLGIPYDEENPPHPKEFGEAITKALDGTDLTLILEPGRVISGNSGVLVTRVTYTKQTPTKNFLIVDAGMNDLTRPALYGSFHRIEEVTPQNREPLMVDVVGPICESSDFLARARLLPKVEQGEYLCVHSAGAYGFTMSSQYNARRRAAEVLVDGDKSTLARKRESYEDLVSLERENL